MDIIDEAGILALATRLERLANYLRKEGLQIYKDHGIDFEPKWFPVIYALYDKSQLSVVEIANEIGYSHPSTISLLKELEKNKLVTSKKDKSDERKRLIRLTHKGNALIDQMKPVWQIIISAVTEATSASNNLMQALIETEEQFRLSGFAQRALRLKKS